MLKTTTITY